VRMDFRFATSPDLTRVNAAELVSLAPDAIVTSTAPATRAVQLATRAIPIVFIGVGDAFDGSLPLVKNIARPEGNTTGVTNLYDSIRAKWLELLKEAAPRVERIGLVYPKLSSDVIYSNAPLDLLVSPGEQVARSLGLHATRIPYGSAVDLVRAIDAFATEPKVGGLIMVVPLLMTSTDRETTLRLATQHRLPVAGLRENAAEGALIGYGTNMLDMFRRAVFFVDRILRGGKVSELPVEFPTKFELAINLKTAKALDLTIPESLLLRADEVIE
jgi:putative ABC transport system substrate-binding protein